jgi:hypothetical protein
MIRYLMLLLLTVSVSCSSHPSPEPTPTRTESSQQQDCYVAPPVGNIVGFGVNGQPRQWGTNGAGVKPALDMLVNDLGSDYFRVEVNNGESDYEATNDDGSYVSFNWTYYDALFSTKRFTDLWNYIRYVNSIASTAHVQLSWHGGLPGWFGGSTFNGDGRSYTLPQAMEGEYVEELLAVMVYARTRAPEPRPQFDLISPFNEPEYSPPEGFSFGTTNPQIQEARVVRKLVDRMNAIPELAGIMLVVGDHANVEGMVGDRPALTSDPVIAARLAATSFHRYSDSTATDWSGANPPVFLSEFGSTWVSDCFSTTFGMALQDAGNVISALKGGVTAALAWSDADATHIHQGTWQSFGLLATTYQGSSNLCDQYPEPGPSDAVLDAMTYTPKPTYYALRHLFRYVRPNATPITMTATNIDAVAYLNGDSTVAIYGRNMGGPTNSTITLTMPNPPAYLTPRITTSTTTDVVGSPVPLTNGQGVFALPGSSVFTLLSSPGSGSGGTGGSGGQGGMSSGGNAGAGGQSAVNGGVSGDGTAGASSGAPSGGQSGSSAGGQSGAGGAASGAGGQSSGGAGMSSGGAGAGGAAAGMAGASGSGGTGGALPALVAGWAFNEGSGTTTADASGHGHTGTINGATWTTTGCKFGSCLSFTGTGHNVTTPDAADLDLGTAFTIMAWVKPTTTAGWRPVLIKENGTNLEAYLLYSNPSNQGAYFTDTGNVEKSVTGGSAISTTQWTNVAMVRNGTTLSYWVNGVSVASTTVSALPVVSSSGILAIGGHTFWGGEWFSGALDDARIYGAALTSAQIATAMNTGL